MTPAWLLPAAASALTAGILAGRGAHQLWPWLLALALAVLAVPLMRRGRRSVALLIVAAALGGAVGYQAYHPALPEEGTYAVTGIVTDEIRLNDNGQVKTVLRSVTLDGKPFGAGVYWTYYLAPGEALPQTLRPGCQVSLTARVYHPNGADNPGGYHFQESLLQKGMTIGAYGSDNLTVTAAPWTLWGTAAALRHDLSLRLIDAMGPEAGGYAAAMLLGNRDLVPQEEREAFSRLGVAHILSVSGFHVGVLAGLIGMILGRLKLSRAVRFAVTAVILAAYSLLTGMNAPVIRASLMMLLWTYGRLRHRQSISVYMLAASWMITLLCSPTQLTSAGFHLSYGAMLGLTLATPWLEGLHTFQHPWARRVWSGLCGTLGAQLGVLLPTLYWFQELPLLGLITNIGLFAVAGVMMTLCWFTLFLLPIPALAALTGRMAGGMIAAMLAAVRKLGSLPGITWWTCRANLVTLIAWAVLLAALSMW